jgi:Ca-activated chloride channel family protein
MLDLHFRHSNYLYLLLAILPVAYLFYWLIEQRKKALLALMGAKLETRAIRLTKYYQLRAALVLFVIGLSIIALARPQWGKTQTTIQIKGADVIIAVDISLSMLAADESPSRLARSRRLCTDLVESLSGNRIGIIAFAGTNSGLMPLTLDKLALESFIDSLNAQLAENSSTSIGQAISQATESLKSAGKQSKVLIIISDGEDQSDNPETAIRQAAQQAAENGIVILTVGVGSTEGSTISLNNIGKPGLKKDSEGKTVITKLQENLLQIASETTSGNYLHLQPNSSEVKEITDFIGKLNRGEISSFTLQEREERFQYFLAIAVIFVLADLLLSAYNRL